MNRRDMILNTLIAGTFLSLRPTAKLFANPNEIIKPKALSTGDTVGIIAPGSAVSDPDDIQRAIEAIELLGLKYKIAPNVVKGSGYKTRIAEERLSDLHTMFETDEIKAIIAIRGGYGSMDMLDGIDYDLIKKNPKIFVGYSDVTALHIAINQLTGLVTFHGPVLLSSLNEYTLTHLKKALYQRTPIGIITNPLTKRGIRKAYPLRTVVEGTAKGQLIGGNLSLIASTIGTKYEIDTNDKILFLEDVGEAPYRIDRMLSQLRLAGKFDKVKGIIWGDCNDCKDDSGGVWDSSVGEVVDKYFAKLNVPVLSGMMIGHSMNQLTLPIGVEAELNSTEQYLNIYESALV